MKKGQIIGLEMLVKFIPHAIVLIVTFVVFVMLVNSFIAQETTPEKEDFERINSEFKTILQSETPFSITVPVKADSPLNVVMFPPGNSEEKCRKSACLCLYPKDSPSKPICYIYPEIRETCGSTRSVCVSGQIFKKSSQTTVTIIRKDNNEIVLV